MEGGKAGRGFLRGGVPARRLFPPLPRIEKAMPRRASPLCLPVFFLCGLGLPCQPLRAAPAAPDYARAPLMRLLHWPRFPLRVFLATHGSEEAQEARDVQRGFDLWVRATGGGVCYVIVDAPDKADLTVRLVPSAALPGKAGAVGMTTVYSHGATLARAEIHLATGEAMGEATPEDITATAAHEFGHALGIQGHSDDPDDLMYPSETRFFSAAGERLPTPAPSVTARDLNTLRACYPALLGPPPAKNVRPS